MILINRSVDSEYHTQRNNARIPYSSCNTTAMIMALKQANIVLPDVGDKQPEDALSELLQTDEAYEMMRELAPWAYDAVTDVPIYLPQQVHMTLAWGTNKFVGADVATFTTSAHHSDLRCAIDEYEGVVLSGRFPMSNGTDLGHIVSLAGYSHNYDEKGFDWSWIIDDPYGDWHTRYRSHRGNNILFSHNEFERIFSRGPDVHYAHFVRRV